MNLRTKRPLCLTALILALIAVCSAILTQPTFALARLEQVESSAECFAVFENSTDRVLYGKNLHKKRPMASTTKIMTAITVIENVSDLDKIVTVPDSAVGVEGSSIYLQRGEKVTVRDLLYGLMLQSGNDCAEALACTVSGSVKEFAALMNRTAEKIGAKDSNFMNPHGLHNDYHYTTAYDLGLISSYAMKNETFALIVSTKKHTMPWQGRDYERVILNKNKILSTFDGGDGIKTGFTKKAGRCLVSSALRNGMRVIAVVLNCGPMFEACAHYMEKAFSEFTLSPVCVAGAPITNVTVREGKSESVCVAAQNTRLYPLTKDETEQIRLCPETVSALSAPVAKGMEAGKMKIYLKNQLLFDEKLVSIEEVGALSVFDKLKDIIHGWNQ